MSKLYIIIFLCLVLKINASAQVSLTQKDSIKIGTKIVFSCVNDTNVLKEFRFGKSGTGHFWDFSGLQSNYFDTAKFLAPNRTFYSSDFEDCTLASGDEGGYYNGFYKTDSTGYYQIGMGGYLQPSRVSQGIRFNHPQPVFKFPASYPYSHTDSNYMRTKMFYNEFDTGFYAQHFYNKREIVATGIIKLPFGKFEAFLLKEMPSSYDTSWYKVNDSTWRFEINVWSSKPTHFAWYCKNSTAPVAQIIGWTEFPVGQDHQEAIYVQMNNYANLKSLNIEDISSIKTTIYPNPATEKLSIENNLPQNSNYIITNLLGQEIDKGLLKSEIDISYLLNGVYFLKIVGTNNQTQVLKFIKQ